MHGNSPISPVGHIGGSSFSENLKNNHIAVINMEKFIYSLQEKG
jgi:hypothetical protein